MNGHSFALWRFPTGPGLDAKITGHIARHEQTLSLSYELRGRLGEVALPGPSTVPARRHGLWQETCFEFFLAPKNLPQYWEFNLSPAGSWNVYHFAGYRQGMAEEMAFTSLPFSVRSRPDSLLLNLEVDLAKIVGADQPLEVAIAAVIKLRDGEATYWALSHPGPQADFHRWESFRVKL